MSTKQAVLLLQKSALEKLLDNSRFFCSGLCHLIAVLYKRNVLTYEESDLLDKLIGSYFENNEKAREAFRRYHGFMWEPGEWEPREDWIYSKLEEINVALDVSI